MKYAKKITKIIFNWHYTIEEGEKFDVYTVDDVFEEDMVVLIIEHLPTSKHDKLYYDVKRKSLITERIFNVNSVQWIEYKILDNQNSNQ